MDGFFRRPSSRTGASRPPPWGPAAAGLASGRRSEAREEVCDVLDSELVAVAVVRAREERIGSPPSGVGAAGVRAQPASGRAHRR